MVESRRKSAHHQDLAPKTPVPIQTTNLYEIIGQSPAFSIQASITKRTHSSLDSNNGGCSPVAEKSFATD